MKMVNTVTELMKDINQNHNMSLNFVIKPSYCTNLYCLKDGDKVLKDTPHLEEIESFLQGMKYSLTK